MVASLLLLMAAGCSTDWSLWSWRGLGAVGGLLLLMAAGCSTDCGHVGVGHRENRHLGLLVACVFGRTSMTRTLALMSLRLQFSSLDVVIHSSVTSYDLCSFQHTLTSCSMSIH